MTVKDAAKLLGKSEQFVRVGLRSGRLPIGTAVKMSHRWTYYISQERLEKFIGGN